MNPRKNSKRETITERVLWEKIQSAALRHLYVFLCFGFFLEIALGDGPKNSRIRVKWCDNYKCIYEMFKYDKAINNALATRVRNRINFKGQLNTYRFCDNVWTFVIEEAEFREGTDQKFLFFMFVSVD